MKPGRAAGAVLALLSLAACGGSGSGGAAADPFADAKALLEERRYDDVLGRQITRFDINKTGVNGAAQGGGEDDCKQ